MFVEMAVLVEEQGEMLDVQKVKRLNNLTMIIFKFNDDFNFLQLCHKHF